MKIIPISNNTNTNNELPEFDRELIASLPSSGPRYTSYPTADRFHEGFKEAEYIQALNLRNMGALNKPPFALHPHSLSAIPSAITAAAIKSLPKTKAVPMPISSI